MRILFQGWKSKGLNCPDMDVSVGGDRTNPRVTLIQMPNGTGKTTTLAHRVAHLLVNGADPRHRSRVASPKPRIEGARDQTS